MQSSGGIFEVEDRGKLVFSKKAVGRFPEDGEVLAILNGVESGMTIEESQHQAAANAPKMPSIVEWFKGMIGNGPR